MKINCYEHRAGGHARFLGFSQERAGITALSCHAQSEDLLDMCNHQQIRY